MTNTRDIARTLLGRASAPAGVRSAPARRNPDRGVMDKHPAVVAAMASKHLLDSKLGPAGMRSPYYIPHTGVNGATLPMLGEDYINFSSYNYLGLAGEPRVVAAARDALETYGTSCGAARLVSGHIPLHEEFERRIAGAYGVDDCVITGSGYLTNAAVIAYVLGPGDVAICDSLVHNSIVAGTEWAHTKRMNFTHNDPEALEALLARSRDHFERAMVIVEGVYSMDGDIVRLPEIIEVARRYDCLIMVDEAHSYGVLGDHGLGVAEHFGIPGTDVDIWMGSLSKGLASHGGFLAGSADLCEGLRMMAPGLSLYAGSPPPASTAAAIAAFDIMTTEPERRLALRTNSVALEKALRERGVDTGLAEGTAVVPAIFGDSQRTMLTAQALLAARVNANPIMYPAVAEGETRIRFFLNADHTPEQLEYTLTALDDYWAGRTGIPVA